MTLDPDVLPDGVRLVDPTEMEGSKLRLPDPDNPLEAPFAAANERSFDLAAETLTRWFPNLPLARFAQATDSTSLVVGKAAPELMDAIDAEGLFERMFQRFHFEPPGHVRFMRDKEPRDLSDIAVAQPVPYPGGRVRLRPAALAAALDEGYTMVLDGVELRDPASIRLAEMFERLFGCAVNINGYLSTRTHTSFGAHWDDQEVVILQLIGSKDWRVEQPVALSPLKSSHGNATSGEVVWEGRLHPGDAVYIPRGWGHLVSGIDELTYHYTITIPRINGVRVLHEILKSHRNSGDRVVNGRPVPMVPTIDAAPAGPSIAEGIHRITASDAVIDAAARLSPPARFVGSFRRLLDTPTRVIPPWSTATYRWWLTGLGREVVLVDNNGMMFGCSPQGLSLLAESIGGTADAE